MNLLENEEMIARNKKSKVIMTIIVILIILLLIVCGVLIYLINVEQKNTLKLNVDNASKSFASDMFVVENGKLYINIKDFGTLMGYEAYNGDFKTKYSEDTTNCYITSLNETASYSLNSNTMYKKVTNNEDYEYFELDEPVRLINNKLYTTIEGMQIGTNSMIQYNTENNQISVLSLDYIVSRYASSFPNAAIADEKADFNNKKALRYELVVVTNAEGHYGVYNAQGQEIIGTKYTSIKFKEDSKEFTVTTDEGKMGILSANGSTKIDPNYDEIKQISKVLNYYLVSNNKKYGVINQNGNIVIHLEYDKIGVDESRFSTNGLESPYILFDNCIPVMQNNKWGIFNVNGQLIIPVEYDEMGCVTGTQSNRVNNNVLIIPQFEAIVIGKEEKYEIVSSLGEQYVPLILNSVYSVTSSGEDKYYMTFTMREEQDGKVVEREETYFVDDYFAEILHMQPNNGDGSTLEENTNTIQGNVIQDTNTVANSETVNETNTVTEGQNQNNVAVQNTVEGATEQANVV